MLKQPQNTILIFKHTVTKLRFCDMLIDFEYVMSHTAIRRVNKFDTELFYMLHCKPLIIKQNCF